MADRSDFLTFVKPVDDRSKEIYQKFYRLFLDGLTSQKKPCVIVFAGGPGSGKTTHRRSAQLKLEKAHVHDMDEILIRLPEYQKDLQSEGPKVAFEKWWPLAREIADALVQYAIRLNYFILYDRTCGAEGSYFDLLKAKNSGYRVLMNGYSVDASVALERIAQREEGLGRTVTKEMVLEYRARFSALWPHYLSFVDEAHLYDTSGSHPKELFSLEKGVKDPFLYQAFLEEGKAYRPQL